jgi:hypothetical protein
MDSMRKKPLALLTGIMVSYMLMAQTTVKRDSIMQYELHLSSTALFSGGNLKRTVTQNRLMASLGNRSVQFVTENSYRFGKNFSRVVENDFLTRNYVRLLPQNRLYAFLLGVYETNYRRSIQSRWQMGAGAAINFYRRGKDYLRFGLSGVYEKARYKVSSFNLPAYNGSSQAEVARAMVRLGGQHTLLNGHLVLKHDTWLMQGLQKANNYR